MSTDAPSRTAVEPPLLTMTRTMPTRLRNDSVDPGELSAAIGWGAVGATCNPVIALAALRSGRPRWRARIAELAALHGTATESEIGWLAVEELSVAAAAQLEPAFRASAGRDGRLSIQTDPRFWRDPQRLIEQAVHFDELAPNVIVKIAATSAGIDAIEELTERGVSVNATVSFTVPQALAVGDAVERGLRRREAAGHDVSHMGRSRSPHRERGYRARLLSAAFRNHMHWSQLIGGDVVISPPFGWQKRLNASGIPAVPRIDDPGGARDRPGAPARSTSSVAPPTLH